MRRRSSQSAFTLIELVLVMFIIAILSGMLAPALIRFTAGRSVENYGRQIVGLAQYARAQSISEARVYRLNFDQNSGESWVTADSGAGNFTAPTNDLSRRFPAPNGVRMQVQVSAQPNMQLLLPATIQQQSVAQSGQLIDGTQAGTAGAIMQNVHVAGQTYVEFQPNGRTDPATITVSDSTGHSIQVACASPTDRFQVQGDAR